MTARWVGWDESMVGVDAAMCTFGAPDSMLEVGADEAVFEQLVEGELRSLGHVPRDSDDERSLAKRWVVTWAGWTPTPEDMERSPRSVALDIDARIRGVS